ncbi:MAG TPA: nucleoside hydrolase [Bryobacteraceae bacterium]|nr:nucleoside hydrolase [Bryobacteraceae bacterium]
MTAAAAFMTTLLLFDTDSGFFGDDGVALTMLMRSPLASSVVGVTVVSGNVWAAKGAEYMERNLRVLKRAKLPVVIGAQEPLVHTAAMSKKEGALQFAGAFGEPMDLAAPSKANAVSFIIDTIDANPGKVTFVALGPMTNLAVALRLRPDLARKIGGLVFMGGAVSVPGNVTPYAEFNFWFDPEAAQVALRSAIPRKIMFGLDVTNQAPIRKSHFDEIVAVKTAITELYREDMGSQFPGFYKNPEAVTYMWDALVAAFLIDPTLATTSETKYLDVDTQFGAGYGRVIRLERTIAPMATPVQVMMGIDIERTRELYRQALTSTR